MQCFIECNASYFAVSAILSQEVEGHLYPVAFHVRKMNKHAINYEIYDIEFLAITSAFKEWRQYLNGTKHKINIYPDHVYLK